MVTIEELKDIIYKEEWNEIERQRKDPNGPIQQRKDREQYYVDNMTLDSRSMSIVGKEQGEDWWQFAPQAQEYRAELVEVESQFHWFVGGYLSFWLGIALWFVAQLL